MSKEKNNVFQTLIAISISLCILILMVKFALAFKSFYYFEVDRLNIESMSNMTKNEIIKNYDYTIDYLLGKKGTEFELPSLPSSLFGKVHFEEVLKIFSTLNIVLTVGIAISIIGIVFLYKKRNFNFIKKVSNILTFFPIIFGAIFSLNFERSFIIFHKIFFRNDYWIFDPQKDPIINILPQEFFFDIAIFILIINFVIAFLLRIIYHKKLKYLK
ncbi:TIGR01906 family membrane protein [Asaccharospora irregularis]|nr:TIGR01906 family membrane protein [Asaccharospora irregularis]